MAFPLIAAIIGGVASLIGGGANIFSSIYGAEKQEDIADEANRINIEQAALNREFNAEQAAINREWTERMSNTAHQREVADLHAAGLNTWLSAGGGAQLGRSSAAANSGFAGAQQANVAGNYARAGEQFSDGIIKGFASFIGSEIMQEALIKDITSIKERAQNKRSNDFYEKYKISDEEITRQLKDLGD